MKFSTASATLQRVSSARDWAASMGVPLDRVWGLGLRNAEVAAYWDGSEFRPRLMVPLSLSYDHRVIDGAEGARFCAHLAQVLGDLRRALL